jgi:hypothetical protein
MQHIATLRKLGMLHDLRRREDAQPDRRRTNPQQSDKKLDLPQGSVQLFNDLRYTLLIS